VANNFMGHGFWQLSPEMLFRVFSPENGYQVQAMLLHERVPEGGWYVICDPDQVRSRVELCNSMPTYVLTIAKRIRLAEVLARAPQQSDYAALWDRTAQGRSPPKLTGSEPKPEKLKWHRHLLRPVERSLKLLAGGRASPSKSPFSKPYYRPVREEALL